MAEQLGRSPTRPEGFAAQSLQRAQQLLTEIQHHDSPTSSPTPVPRGILAEKFAVKQATGCKGHDHRWTEDGAKSLEDCAKACIADAQCVGFTYCSKDSCNIKCRQKTSGCTETSITNSNWKAVITWYKKY